MLKPQTGRIVLIGGGRNANYLVGLFEGVGIEVAAILDDRAGGEVLGHPVTGINAYSGPEWAALMTIIDPELRRSIVARPALRPCVWTSYIDPRSVTSGYAIIGEGAFLSPFVVCANAVIGEHVFIMPSVVIGPRVQIGGYSCVLPNSTIGSDAEIGSGCIIGMGARIAAGVRIGNDCRIAPNTFVRKDLQDGSIVTSKGAGVRIMRRAATCTPVVARS